MNLSRILLFTLLMISFQCGFSSVHKLWSGPDTIRTDSSIVRIFHILDPFLFIPAPRFVDSVAAEVPLMRSAFPIASPAAPMPNLFPLQFNKVTMNSGLPSQDPFNFNVDSLSFLKTRTPYTKLILQVGSKKEQFFDAIHSQNITRQANLTARVIRSNGEGFYLRQNFFIENYALSGNFKTKNQCYGALFHVIYRNFKRDESGGIRYDSLFSDNVFLNKKLIPVNLNNARSRNTQREIFFSQLFYFGRKDSLATPGNYFSLTSHISDNWYVYSDKDPQSGFYENIYKDSVATYDSTYALQWKNSLGLRLCLGHFFIEPSVQHSFFEHWPLLSVGSGDTVFTDLAAKIQMGDLGDAVRCRLSIEYTFSGPGKGAYGLVFEHKYFLENVIPALRQLTLRPYFRISSYSGTPVPYFFTSYAGNHYSWENDFALSNSSTDVIAGIAWEKFRAKLSYRYFYAFGKIYFNESGLPFISGDNLFCHQVKVEKSFSFRQVRFSARAAYQLSNSDILPVPEWDAAFKFYWQKDWSKSGLRLQIGSEVNYLAAYSPGRYIPALNVFAVDSTQSTGDYIYPSIFANMTIKRVVLWVRVDNAYSGLIPNRHYTAPGYPADDRSFRFGVAWKFFD